MNKTAIKNYAIRARVQLIESAKQRAYEYEITEDGENNSNLDSVGGRLLSSVEKEQRKELISQIRAKGYTQVMEEAAYTWFNRFIALRFMEVNGYLPSKVRVFTDENNAFKPEILREAMNVEIDGIDKAIVLDLLDKQNNEELYKYLLITQCNALNAGLPYMFEKIANWTELLFPSNLLRQDSILAQMIAEIPEEDWTDAVQIIGWLYQYYNSELKDETFALLKKNVKISKDRIPAATQIFTPDWIVRYMVENSLGRLWYEGHNDFDKSQWKYYLDEAEQEPEVQAKLDEMRKEYANIKPEEIKVIDPCMGSGHILVYAFDVLMQIYESAGWSERDAAKSIIENNLYGLDIDDRAGQLAYFAVMMKARKYNRRILNDEVNTNIMSIQDSSDISDNIVTYIGTNGNKKAEFEVRKIVDTFKNAKEIGSALIMPQIDFSVIDEAINIIFNSFEENLINLSYKQTIIDKLLSLIKLAKVMSQKYDVVVTNPPYMSSSIMDCKLISYLKNNYNISKSDLFAIFVSVALRLTNNERFISLITMQSLMFLTSYVEVRNLILNESAINNMLHLGAGAFEELNAFNVLSTSFVLRKTKTTHYFGRFLRLIKYTKNSLDKEKHFNDSNVCFITDQFDFKKLPNQIIGYWISERMKSILISDRTMEKISPPRTGMMTSDNKKFLRFWFEPESEKIGYNIKSVEDSVNSKKVWFPYIKGGNFRRWYGNREYVVDWFNEGQNIFNNGMTSFRGKNYYFKEGITWSIFGFENFCARLSPVGSLFDIAGTSTFPSVEDFSFILGLLNSKVAYEILILLNPSVNFQNGDIKRIPIIKTSNEIQGNIDAEVNDNIAISRTDWDSYETSWDFKKNPLI